MNTKYKIGDRVKHIRYGTFGRVIDFDPNLGVYVYWDNGTSGYYVESSLS